MSDPTTNLYIRETWRYRVAAGWVAVLVIFLRLVVYPTITLTLQAFGLPGLAGLPPMNWEAVMALVGMPIGGAFADKLGASQ